MKLNPLPYLLAVILTIPPALIPVAQAQQSEATVIEEIVIIGSRRQDGRSQTESLVPVDVFGGEDLSNMGSTDMDQALSNLIPSYKVDTQAINDAATLVRPATLRGLPPDSTLVLVNGKRRHRAAVITFLGNGVADGSQGPDISVIPSVALKRVEVLRDGAAAQYGSDAIAGVINFELKDDAEGGAFEARWGQHYEGDGDGFNFAGNVGLPMTSNGFLNLSMEYKESDPTSRALQRSDAQALVDAGNPYIEDPSYDSVFHPTVMVWGAPEFKYDYKFFGNMGIDLSDSFEAYGYGNYAKRKVEGGFYFRNPHTRSGVFDGPVITVPGHHHGEETYDTVKVADIDGIGIGGECPAIRIIDDVASAEDIAAVEADPNCESFITRFPGGFVPRFGGTMEDYSFAFGVRGDLAGDWYVDLSGVYGRHKASFFMKHTLNPQLLALPEYTVANIPTDYEPGIYTETDYSLNLDVSKSLDMPMFAAPVNLAFGVEHRQEEFKVTQGGMTSWYQDLRPGGLTEQGFGVGSNGFTGFGPRLAGTWSRNSYAGYIDVEAPVTDRIVLGAAGRYEDHKGVGDTADFKISARADMTDNFALRGAVSTGFRAPTVGQANILNVTTAFTGGMLADEATLPPTHPASALVGGQPLTPEESTNFTVGAVFNAGDLDVTIDYFNIKVEDRIARSSNKVLTDADRQTLIGQGVTDAAAFSQVRFYTNDFDTTTQGIDIVATLPVEMMGGNTDFSFAGNWTDTEVDKRNPDVIDDKRVIQLEQNNPEFRFTATAEHNQGPWRMLLRGRFYDGFVEFSTDDGSARLNAGSRFLMDAELGYSLNDNITLVAGAENFIDTTPTHQRNNECLDPSDPSTFNCPSGMQYAETSPYGFNGGFYYFRALYNW
ncbi:MAG: TonB-dependent receptor [Gammaproteobacteria bacterium]|nr:TonB-dependent receptor [Gammaproteobacteria bacterium]MDE0286721.1 TonB-dependent receptor [Gammaproteobacteria bacterium]